MTEGDNSLSLMCILPSGGEEVHNIQAVRSITDLTTSSLCFASLHMLC